MVSVLKSNQMDVDNAFHPKVFKGDMLLSI